MARWLIWAGANGFVAVAAGAFAAHALQRALDPAALAWVETAARYQMFHALALLGLGVLEATGRGSRWTAAAGVLHVVGIVLFCGSLYALALSGVRAFAWVTPFGGLALLGGWIALTGAGVAAARRR